MKKNLLSLVVAAVGAAASLSFTSCAYDPYYSSVGGSYSSGYGDGYGYGGSSFSTSFFVGTGDPRWGYDPYCYSYYDYHRHCYYDPYLNGYYPLGYRPAVVYGVPHPYGWRPGHGYLPPPRNVSSVTVVNYRNREVAYHNTNYSWARQVRQQPVGQGRVQGERPNQQFRNQSSTSGYHATSGGSSSNYRQSQTRTESNRAGRSNSEYNQQQQYRHNSAVNAYSQQQKNPYGSQKNNPYGSHEQAGRSQKQQYNAAGNYHNQGARNQAPREQSQPHREGKGNKQNQNQPSDEDKHTRGWR
ncbi:MAG: hypothetical protein ABI162_05130 [Luteolibacter sp.]